MHNYGITADWVERSTVCFTELGLRFSQWMALNLA